MGVLLLVRHGQASFGRRDYDVLSERGHEQAALLGRALRDRGVEPARVVHGGMRRQRDTADAAVAAAGWPLEAEVDTDWAEFDHEAVIVAHRPAYRRGPVMKADLARTLQPHRAFQAMFVEATARWSGGEHDADYGETFTAFGERVDRAVEAVSDRDGTTVVVTSGGVIGVVAARLLTGDVRPWSRLNSVTVNTGVTKLVIGASGPAAVSFNEHTHLEHDRSLITYR